MTDWRQEAARAVEAELEHVQQTDEWSLLGLLQHTSENAYVVDVRGHRISPLDDIRIADENGPRQGPAVLAEGTLEGGVLWLHDVGPLPPECDRVWVRQVSPDVALSRLSRGLRDIGYAPLADQLAAGQLDPVDNAADVCFTPGLRLVWGPPGTGKTSAIAKAVTDLARAGKRVLHVTADDPPKLPTPSGEGRSIQKDLVELAAADRRLAELDEILAGYHHDTFLAAEQRIEHGQQSKTLEAEFADVRQHHAEVAEELAQAQAYVQTAQQARDRAAQERSIRAEVHVLTERLARLDARSAGLRERLRANGRVYWGKRSDRKDLHAAEVERSLLAARVEQAQRGARRYTDDEMQVLETEFANAQVRLTAAVRAESEIRAQLELLRGKIARLHSMGLASDQDHRFYAECLRRDLPTLRQEREQLRQQSQHRAALRGRLEERLWWLGERAYQYRCEAGAAAWESGQVVTTTLGRHFFTSRPFDVVIVDDAGSARLAEVLLAVAQARETAVVFGDFCRPGPRVHPAGLQNVPEVSKWTLATPFSHCGIYDPVDAHAHPGCLVLTRQFRFGAAVRRLANSIGYEVLEGGEQDATEVILLDTEGEPTEQAATALIRVLAAHGGAVLVPRRSQLPPWLDVLHDTFTAAVGTPHTLAEHEFSTVVLDLSQDDWHDRPRSFAAGITRARDRLYLLADLNTVKVARNDSPLGLVNSLCLDGTISVRKLDDVLIPRQRQQSPIDRRVNVTNRNAPDGTMSG